MKSALVIEQYKSNFHYFIMGCCCSSDILSPILDIGTDYQEMEDADKGKVGESPDHSQSRKEYIDI